MSREETRRGYVSLVEAADAWSTASTSSLARQASTASDTAKMGDETSLRRHRKILSMAYFLAMGVSGIVLRHLATKIGPVFITRSIGSAFGAIVSTQLYGRMRKNVVICLTIQALVAVLMYLPFITSVWSLHVSLLAAGFLASIVDTGIQIMTQRLYGPKAGPYLGANLLAYSVSGAYVPVVAYITTSLVRQYAILAAITAALGIAMIIPPAPETVPGMMEEIPEPVTMPTFQGGLKIRTIGSRWRAFCERYQIEFCIGATMFWIVGGKDGATSLLKKYVLDTEKSSGGNEHLLVEWLWLAFVIGRLVGLLDLQYVVNIPRLHRQLTILFLCGAAGAVAVLVFEGSKIVLWAGVAAYGLSNGPLCGYSSELYNRVAIHSDTGVAMVVFGMNTGSMMPYVISWVWDETVWPPSLFVILAASHLVPLWLILNSRRVAESKENKDMSECETSTCLSDSEETGLLDAIPE